MAFRDVDVHKRLTLPPSDGSAIVDVFDGKLYLPQRGGAIVMTPDDEAPLETSDARVLQAFVAIDGANLPLGDQAFRVSVARDVVRYSVFLRYAAAQEADVTVHFRFRVPYRPRSYAHISQRKLENEEARRRATETLAPGASRVCAKI